MEATSTDTQHNEKHVATQGLYVCMGERTYVGTFTYGDTYLMGYADVLRITQHEDQAQSLARCLPEQKTIQKSSG